jgi:hypothetical protein
VLVASSGGSRHTAITAAATQTSQTGHGVKRFTLQPVASLGRGIPSAGASSAGFLLKVTCELAEVMPLVFSFLQRVQADETSQFF